MELTAIPSTSGTTRARTSVAASIEQSGMYDGADTCMSSVGSTYDKYWQVTACLFVSLLFSSIE